MAFPVVQSTNNWTSGTTASTSHTVNLPSGIQEGDRLVLIFTTSADLAFTTINTPSGWTLVASRQGGVVRSPTCIFSKVAGASESSTVTVTQSDSVRSSTNSYRISNAENIEATFNASNSTNPPSLSPTWGSDDNMWIAIYSSRHCGSGASAPTNYTNMITAQTVTSSTNNVDNEVYSARRNLFTATEDPDSFTASSENDQPTAGTIAIRGGAGTPNTGNFLAFM